MEVTEVKVSLVNGGNSKLKAFANITFDREFVVRDLKIIQGQSGLFVAMPGTQVRVSCPRCGRRNPIRDRFCGNCGSQMPSQDHRGSREAAREDHRDVAHPITAAARAKIAGAVIEEYERVAAEQAAPTHVHH
jgi:stage V sporulation protein G